MLGLYNYPTRQVLLVVVLVLIPVGGSDRYNSEQLAISIGNVLAYLMATRSQTDGTSTIIQLGGCC